MKEIAKTELVLYSIIIPVKCIYVLYLLVQSLVYWKRKEFFVQTILWLQFVSIPLLIITAYQGESFETNLRKKCTSCDNISFFNQKFGIINSVTTLILALRYEYSARLLPWVLKEIAVDLNFSEQKDQSLLLNEYTNSPTYYENLNKNMTDIDRNHRLMKNAIHQKIDESKKKSWLISVLCWSLFVVLSIISLIFCFIYKNTTSHD